MDVINRYEFFSLQGNRLEQINAFHYIRLFFWKKVFQNN